LRADNIVKEEKLPPYDKFLKSIKSDSTRESYTISMKRYVGYRKLEHPDNLYQFRFIQNIFFVHLDHFISSQLLKILSVRITPFCLRILLWVKSNSVANVDIERSFAFYVRT
jgi:hypothetical protein